MRLPSCFANGTGFVLWRLRFFDDGTELDRIRAARYAGVGGPDWLLCRQRLAQRATSGDPEQEEHTVRQCYVCGRKITLQACVCPGCGHSHGEASSRGGGVFALIALWPVIMGVLGLLLYACHQLRK